VTGYNNELDGWPFLTFELRQSLDSSVTSPKQFYNFTIQHLIKVRSGAIYSPIQKQFFNFTIEQFNFLDIGTSGLPALLCFNTCSRSWGKSAQVAYPHCFASTLAPVAGGVAILTIELRQSLDSSVTSLKQFHNFTIFQFNNSTF